jgi:hypothetical protein
MPAISALTINDGAATPVARTFAVQNASAGKATWLEKSAGVSIGYIKLTDEFREAKSPTGANSRILAVEMPTVAVVNGVTTRVRVSSSQVRLNFAQDATDQERKDLLAFMTNALSNAILKPAISGQEPVFG